MTGTNQMGGPAFPIPATDTHDTWPGMSLRDWFAGQALGNMNIEEYKSDQCARWAYEMADAMLEARK